MTIEYRKGNLLDVTEGIIVHGCNAQGVMGSGVALAVKKKYPECYDIYTRVPLSLGEVVWYDASTDYNDPPHELWIANAITQEFYGTGKRYVNYAAIAECFKKVFRNAKALRAGYHDVHFPKIGAGLGGGDWSIIEQIINDCDPYDKVKKICWEL